MFENPDNPAILTEVARTARLRGSIEEARNYLLLALQKDPKFLLALIEVGLLHFEMKNFEDARKYFEKASKDVNTENFNNSLYLIEVLWETQNYNYCNNVCKKVAKISRKKSETEALEELYDKFVINTDIKSINDPQQLSILILLSETLERDSENTFFKKSLSKKFPDLY